MILDTAVSTNGVPVRLTDERWEHITDEHPGMSGFYHDILEAIEAPEYILRGHRGARVAVVNVGKDFLHVFYKEVTRKDGFIITAFFQDDFDRKLVIWRKHEN